MSGLNPERLGRGLSALFGQHKATLGEIRNIAHALVHRYRLAWYSARRGRMALRANIAEALKPHTDRQVGGPVYDGKTITIKTEPTWCDCCGVPYPCHTRRMLTRPPMEADQ